MADSVEADIPPRVSDFVLTSDADDNSPCLTFADTTMTRAEVLAAVDVTGRTLRGLAIGPGDIVAVSMENGLEIVPALLAVWASGAAVAPLNPRLGARDLQKHIAGLRPGCVITGAANAVALAGAVDGPAIVVGEDGTLYRDAAKDSAANKAPPGAALILHTSGTSGTPKAVVVSHGALLGAVESVFSTLGRRGQSSAGSANLMVLPLAHAGGIFNILLTFRTGRRLIVQRRFEIEPFLAAVAEYQVRSVTLTPTMVQMLLAADVPAERFGPLRWVRSASAPLPAPVARRFWDRYGIPVLNSYGQTETSGEVIGWTAGHFKEFGTAKLGSIGRPNPGVEIKFIDEHGASVPDGETGELCIRTRFSMDGYLSGAAVSDRITGDGFLRTGDLGHLDADGFVWLAGRRGDVIVCGGFKIMPEEVEDVLREHPLVADVMVAGLPDERLGESPHAFVVTAGSHDDVSGAVIEHVRAHLTHYKAPREVHIVAEIPRNANGKVVRARAAELLAHSPEPRTTRSGRDEGALAEEDRLGADPRKTPKGHA